MKHLRNAPGAARGFSLIELMIALLLGLLVTAGAIGVFISNRATYAATESLGRIQENARVAFELMARDLREAGNTACANNIPIANILNNPTNNWWTNFGAGLVGYDGGALAGTLAGTDAIEIKGSQSTGISVSDHNPTAASMKLNRADHGFVDDDIVMVCDYRQASIFQITNIQAGRNLVHNTGTGSVGNCSKGLGFQQPINCSTNGNAYQYGTNSQVVRLQAARWFVADNGRGGSSLFRVALRGGGLGAAEEVVEGVQDLQIEYLLPNATNYVASTAVPAARWREVTAVRLRLTLSGQNLTDRNNVGTDGQALQRVLEHIVTLRNRNA